MKSSLMLALDIASLQLLRVFGTRREVRRPGIRLKRDSVVSVMYPEEPDSAKSSVTLQRTDRHEILGQKPTDFQVFL